MVTDQGTSEDVASPEAPGGEATESGATATAEPASGEFSGAEAIDGGEGIEPAPVTLADPVEPKFGFIWGTGRRKRAVARVRIRSGSGKFIVNGKEMTDFFRTEDARLTVMGPLKVTETEGKYDVYVNVSGGGITGQAGATALGLGRALKGAEPRVEVALREAGFLTRDSRMKERKKYGLRGARRAFQFSKR